MKKYVKVILDNKKHIHLPLDKWEKILQSPNNLVAYSDDEGEWSGESFNKFKVVHSEYDEEYSKRKAEPSWGYYRNLKTKRVVKALDGQLPDDISMYEKL